MATYQLGDGDDLVTLIVDINTVGLAASRAIVIQVSPTSLGVAVANSVNASGDISRKNIGDRNNLKNKRLSILTKIDLWGDRQQREDQFNSITATYAVNGGIQGLTVFQTPQRSVDSDFRSVLLHQAVDFN
jgi:hypothetical protein